MNLQKLFVLINLNPEILLVEDAMNIFTRQLKLNWTPNDKVYELTYLYLFYNE